MPTARTKENSVTKIDSVKNWRIKCERNDPITLRTPTSLARLLERAVDNAPKRWRRAELTRPQLSTEGSRIEQPLQGNHGHCAVAPYGDLRFAATVRQQ